jgi:short-subunit dehydrogenase involved in D-alanine esterification of teichoic acids
MKLSGNTVLITGGATGKPTSLSRTNRALLKQVACVKR